MKDHTSPVLYSRTFSASKASLGTSSISRCCQFGTTHNSILPRNQSLRLVLKDLIFICLKTKDLEIISSCTSGKDVQVLDFTTDLSVIGISFISYNIKKRKNYNCIGGYSHLIFVIFQGYAHFIV